MSDSSNPVQPDVEIYIKRAEVEDITTWLADHFTVGESRQAGETIKYALGFEGKPLTCTVLPKAARGGYVSVLFEPNNTPWATDEACAEEAWEHFGLEVRCSIGGWNGDEDDTGGWYRYTDKGRSVVNWLT